MVRARFSTWTSKRLAESFIEAKRPNVFDPDKYLNSTLIEEVENRLKSNTWENTPLVVIIDKMEFDRPVNDLEKEKINFVTEFQRKSFTKEEELNMVTFFVAIGERWMYFVSGDKVSKFGNEALKDIKQKVITDFKLEDYNKAISTIVGDAEKYRDGKNTEDKKFTKNIIFAMYIFVFCMIIASKTKANEKIQKELVSYYERLVKLSATRPVEQLLQENCNFCFERLQSEPIPSAVLETKLSKSTLQEALILPCSHIFHRKCAVRYLDHTKKCIYCSKNGKTSDYPSLASLFIELNDLDKKTEKTLEPLQNYYIGPNVNTSAIVDPVELQEFFDPKILLDNTHRSRRSNSYGSSSGSGSSSSFSGGGSTSGSW